MRLIDYSVQEFISNLDSASPAPGGGSASAISAAMGSALVRMVGHLTIPKKKFKALDETAQNAFIDVHESLKDYQREAMKLVDEDTDAFNEIMKAFKMPKDTEKDKENRKKAIEAATYKATEVPLRLVELAYNVLYKMEIITKYGNKNAISDVGVAALMMHSALEGAALNVKINLSSISDEMYTGDVTEKLYHYLNDGKRLKEDILEKVNAAL